MIAKPLSAQELCESVRSGVAFDAARLDRVLGVDESRGLVEVQSGATWKRLAAHLRPHEAELGGLRTTCPTVGQSLVRNAAGPDGRPTVSHVEAFTMVTPEGHLRRIDRINHSSLFSLAIGGLGVFGALYSVTLRLESLARAVADARPPQTLLENASRALRTVQLLVPPANVEALLAGCRERLAQWRIAPQSVQVRSIRSEHETFLRWAGREYAEVSLGLERGTTLGAEVRHTQLIQGLIDVAIDLGGGFPIACTPAASRSQTEACYPQLPQFLAEQRRLDPHERWVNRWLRHQRCLFGRQACEVRWGR